MGPMHKQFSQRLSAAASTYASEANPRLWPVLAPEAMACASKYVAMTGIVPRLTHSLQLYTAKQYSRARPPGLLCDVCVFLQTGMDRKTTALHKREGEERWAGKKRHLSTTTNLSLQSDTRSSPDVDCSHSLWPVDFVPADGKQVNVHLADIDRDLSNRLSCIGVEEDLLGSAQLTYGLDGLNHTCRMDCMILPP